MSCWTWPASRYQPTLPGQVSKYHTSCSRFDRHRAHWSEQKQEHHSHLIDFSPHFWRRCRPRKIWMKSRIQVFYLVAKQRIQVSLLRSNWLGKRLNEWIIINKHLCSTISSWMHRRSRSVTVAVNFLYQLCVLIIRSFYAGWSVIEIFLRTQFNRICSSAVKEAVRVWYLDVVGIAAATARYFEVIVERCDDVITGWRLHEPYAFDRWVVVVRVVRSRDDSALGVDHSTAPCSSTQHTLLRRSLRGKILYGADI